MTAIDRIHVVIPVHDEEALLPGCLAAVGRAAQLLGVCRGAQVVVTVVLDACTDRSAEIAAASLDGVRVDVVAIDARCVGLARAAGVEHVRDLSGTTAPERVWVAMTDADSQVPPTWLTAQRDLAESGAELVVGRVHPDHRDLSPGLLARWWQEHRSRPPRVAIHGANLGFTLAAYLRAGGFPPLAEHEDVAFVRAAVAAGSRWTQAGAWVRTSGRSHGRTPGGFAGYLRTLDVEPEGVCGA